MDFRLGHRQLSWRKRGVWRGLAACLGSTCNRANGIHRGTADNAAADMTIIQSAARNSSVSMDPDLYYVAYATAKFDNTAAPSASSCGKSLPRTCADSIIRCRSASSVRCPRASEVSCTGAYSAGRSCMGHSLKYSLLRGLHVVTSKRDLPVNQMLDSAEHQIRRGGSLRWGFTAADGAPAIHSSRSRRTVLPTDGPASMSANEGIMSQVLSRMWANCRRTGQSSEPSSDQSSSVAPARPPTTTTLPSSMAARAQSEDHAESSPETSWSSTVFDAAAWIASPTDGLCSVYTQVFPRLCRAADSSIREPPHQHMGNGPAVPCTASAGLSPGIWYSEVWPADHVGLVTYPQDMALHSRFAEAFWARLKGIDDVWYQRSRIAGGAIVHAS